MADIGFYHLLRTGPDQALPTLLGRTLKAGQRAAVRCGSPEPPGGPLFGLSSLSSLDKLTGLFLGLSQRGGRSTCEQRSSGSY